MSDELFEGCARRGGVCDCGERPCAIDARANRPGFGNFPVCERHWRKLQGDREPTRIVDPPERRCCFCGKANRDGIGMRLDRRAVSYPETELP